MAAPHRTTPAGPAQTTKGTEPAARARDAAPGTDATAGGSRTPATGTPGAGTSARDGIEPSRARVVRRKVSFALACAIACCIPTLFIGGALVSGGALAGAPFWLLVFGSCAVVAFAARAIARHRARADACDPDHC